MTDNESNESLEPGDDYLERYKAELDKFDEYLDEHHLSINSVGFNLLVWSYQDRDNGLLQTVTQTNANINLDEKWRIAKDIVKNLEKWRIAKDIVKNLEQWIKENQPSSNS